MYAEAGAYCVETVDGCCWPADCGLWAVLYWGTCDMYGLIGTISGRVGINCKYWMPLLCWFCGKYCMMTGVGPANKMEIVSNGRTVETKKKHGDQK